MGRRCPRCSPYRPNGRRPVYPQKERDAKERARSNYLPEYILVPRGDNEHDHLGYIRNGEGEYEKKATRLAVFRHLLTVGKGAVPSRKVVGLG